MKNSKLKNILMIVTSDIITFNIAFLLAYWFRMKSHYFSTGFVPLSSYLNAIVFTNLMLLIVFTAFSLYKVRRTSSFIDEFLAITKALFLIFLTLTAATFLLKTTIFSRLIIALTFMLATLLVSVSRFALTRKAAIINKQSCAIYSDNTLGRRILKKINSHPELGYYCIGFIKRLEDIKKNNADVVFITANIAAKELAALSVLKPNTEFKIVPTYTELITEPLTLNELQDIPLITLTPATAHPSYLVFKRVFDIVVALFLLIILSVPFLGVSILIKITSKGPIIYKQKRIGKNERFFDCYKFRTMKDIDIEVKNETAYLFKTANDPRITPTGKVMRRFCIDELPQLINVIKGDMSLVGPRPHLKEELKGLEPWQKHRFDVLPGMTGLWQISGRHELSFEKSVLLDLYYVKNMSFKLDLEVMLKTAPAILFSNMG